MRRFVQAFIAVAVLLATCPLSFADAIYNVTVDTSSLIQHPAGPFYFFAAITDGSTIGDGNNTIKLSDISFGGGGAVGSPILFGDAAGSSGSGFTITDSSFSSYAYQEFVPGSALSFVMGLTSNNDFSGVPDGFALYLLDSSGMPIPTMAPFADYFLSASFGSGGPVFDAYGSDPGRALTVGDPVSIPAPTVTPGSVTPEPNSLVLLMTGVATLAGMLGRRHAHHACDKMTSSLREVSELR